MGLRFCYDVFGGISGVVRGYGAAKGPGGLKNPVGMCSHHSTAHGVSSAEAVVIVPQCSNKRPHRCRKVF